MNLLDRLRRESVNSQYVGCCRIKMVNCFEKLSPSVVSVFFGDSVLPIEPAMDAYQFGTACAVIRRTAAWIATVLSDNGREYCGRPQSNGFVERLHRTLLDEHHRIMERKKFHDSIEAMQKDLDAYLITY